MDEATIIGCWALASTQPWGACLLVARHIQLFFDSGGRLTESNFFPFPLPKGDPQCEAVIPVINDSTSRWMPSDISAVFSFIPTRAHSCRLPQLAAAQSPKQVPAVTKLPQPTR